MDPPGAKHALDQQDIQTFVVQTGKRRIFSGWDELLDRGIYERFDHGRLARIWVPILSSEGTVVGTIEAGCNKDRMPELFTEAAIARVEQLGRTNGDQIASIRPHVLLQGIARHAIQFVDAESAALHVYRHSFASGDTGHQWGELVLATGAGKATPEFVRAFQPRPHGRGSGAIHTGRTEWLDDRYQFQLDHPELYNLGVRALAVIPLKLGPDTTGLLSIHVWRGGKRFTVRELRLAEMFAHEMEAVITNYLLLRQATESGSRSWALSGLQTLMQSLNSPFNLPDVLRKIARNALLSLDADNVTVYPYLASDHIFSLPPIVDPYVPLSSPARSSELHSQDTLLQIVNRGHSHFIEDVTRDPLTGTAGSADYSPFVSQEHIKSSAILLLRSGDDGEVVGVLFVDFYRSRSFSAEEKRAMYALAGAAATAIRTARLHQSDLNRQLAAIHEIHAAIAERGPDLTIVLQRLLQQTLVLTGATYGACLRWNLHSQLLETIATYPPRRDDDTVALKLGQGIVGLAAQSRRSILVNDTE